MICTSSSQQHRFACRAAADKMDWLETVTRQRALDDTFQGFAGEVRNGFQAVQQLREEFTQHQHALRSGYGPGNDAHYMIRDAPRQAIMPRAEPAPQLLAGAAQPAAADGMQLANVQRQERSIASPGHMLENGAPAAVAGAAPAASAGGAPGAEALARQHVAADHGAAEAAVRNGVEQDAHVVQDSSSEATDQERTSSEVGGDAARSGASKHGVLPPNGGAGGNAAAPTITAAHTLSPCPPALTQPVAADSDGAGHDVVPRDYALDESGTSIWLAGAQKFAPVASLSQVDFNSASLPPCSCVAVPSTTCNRAVLKLPRLIVGGQRWS